MSVIQYFDVPQEFINSDQLPLKRHLKDSKGRQLRIKKLTQPLFSKKIKFAGNSFTFMDFENAVVSRRYVDQFGNYHNLMTYSSQDLFDSFDDMDDYYLADRSISQLLKVNYEKTLTDDEKEFRQKRSLYESLRRSQNAVIDFMNSNLFAWKETPKFLTYTFADEVTDLKIANKHFSAAMKRLSYHVFKDRSCLAYLAIPEIQEKRAEKYGKRVWHYHIILFNCPYLTHEVHTKIWGHGMVNIQGFMRGGELKKLFWNEEIQRFETDSEVVKNVAAYVAKTLHYSIKDLDSRVVGRNKKTYLHSRNLKKPKIFHILPVDYNLITEKIRLSQGVKLVSQQTYDIDFGGTVDISFGFINNLPFLAELINELELKKTNIN